jgi:hypothetical protein
MVAKEQPMSEAKRDQSAFHQSALSARTIGLRNPARLEHGVAAILAELRVLEPWENKAISGGDPYNGMGARAGARYSRRK